MSSRPTRQRARGPRLHHYGDGARRGCVTEKVRFPSHFHAQEAAELLMNAGQVNPGCHQTPYPCALCGDWHVGNRLVVFREAR